MKSIENNRFYSGFGKRLFDIAFSSVFLIVLLPVLVIIWALVKLSGGGPGLFKQERIGKHGNAFVLYKFRTMTTGAKSNGPLVTSGNDSRVTVLGRHLRKFKLDELPQLYNVLKGDMSVVGPRPESSKYVDLFQKDYSYILQVSPGLTDYAALEYRNEEQILAGYDDPEDAYVNIILPKKITLYKKYISEISFKTDIKIVLRTLVEVLKF